MRERFTENLAPEIQANLFGPGLKEDLEHYYKAMKAINKAHLLMLVKQGIIGHEVGGRLAQALLSMDGISETELNFSAEKEDLYFNIESFLISKLGMEVAGRLHTGRSRNDLYATAARIKVREIYFETCEMVNMLRRTLLELARKEINTVAPGYTHMQAAEPITLGHYFAGIAEALDRDYGRLEDCYKRLNLCPLGAGALAGSSFNLDRKLVAKYLGFDGLIENSLDAVASRDFLAEFLAGLALLMTTISRIAQDLYIWATNEFQVIEVADSVAACSSIMPQKKNPVTFEHVKSKAGHVYGALMSVLSTLKGTPFTHCRDVSSESFRMFWPAVVEVQKALILLNVTISGMKINRQILVDRTKRNYSTVTELANNLVRFTGMSFREAHGIVGGIVGTLVNEGLDANAIDISHIKNALIKVGVELPLETLEQIASTSLDPVNNVNAKRSTGSPAPWIVSETIAALENNLLFQQTVLNQRKVAITEAEASLNNEINQLALRNS